MRLHSSLLALALLLLGPASARAAFHLWDITEVYSNADGSVQFVEFFTNADFEEQLVNHVLASAANNPDFTFPGNLPTHLTANRFFLVATPGYSALCPGALPDYTFPAANFHSVTGPEILDFASVDSFPYAAAELPTDGVRSLNEPFGSNVRTTAVNSPTNFAGQTCLPEPSAFLAQIAGVVGLAGLGRWRRRRR